MKNGKVHLRAPGKQPTRPTYPRILCTSLRAKHSREAVLYRNFSKVPVKSRCKLCNAIYKRLRRNGGHA